MNFVAPGSSTTLDLVGEASVGGNYVGLDNASAVQVQAVLAPSGVAILGLCTIAALFGLKPKFSEA